MNARTIAYWTTTGVLVFAMLSGGIGELGQHWGTLETVSILGYPPYFLTILGLWKVLGTIALIGPRFPRLREWAYAGIFFNMTGAAASHAFAGDYGVYGFHVIATLLLAVLAVASWALQPQSGVRGDAREPTSWGRATVIS
jgi:hypothetical protein